MRCLHCGKELALLKRLTGGGDFCSDAHKHLYQEEYNRIGLNRLLQAQARSNKAAGPKAPDPPATAPVPVAVEEPVEQAEEPVLESALEATEMAGFLSEKPLASAPPAASEPYLETWLEWSPGPAMPEWRLEVQAPTLPKADLLPLGLRPTLSTSEHLVMEANVTPNEITSNAQANPRVPLPIAAEHHLPPAGPIAVDIYPQTPAFAVRPMLDTTPVFEVQVQWQKSDWLQLVPTGIEFPGAENELGLASVEVNQAVPEATAVSVPADEPPTDASPRAALEALSKLHQEMVEVEASPAETPVEMEPVAVAPEEPLQRDTPPVQSPDPRPAPDLLEISIKSFAPSKPSHRDTAALTGPLPVLIPRLTGLPLRVKMALTPRDYSGPSQPAPAKAPPVEQKKPSVVVKPAQSVQAPPAARPMKEDAPAKPVQAAPPAAPPAKPAVPVKPVQPAAPAKPAGPAQPSKATQATQATGPQISGQTSPLKKGAPPKLETSPKQGAPAKPDTQVKPEIKQDTSAKKPSPASKPTDPAPAKPAFSKAPAPAAVEKADSRKEKAESVIATKESPEKTAPSFGAVTGTSFRGSPKVKIVVAILFVVIAVVAYFNWGSKSTKPTAGATPAADAAGPSIMVGQGGWVEGWGGDPKGASLGRQITIYRPSLKLSDYRIDFQGQVETKSIGWVFRAADPDNYYAMKLAMVATGLSPKIALFKYIISSGRQTQVGRVPIDLAVRTDTVFNVRVDVRGPRFSTYVQGQQVDVWTDDQLKSGGVGFLNEREERGKVKSVSISYLNGNK
jgi:hypothetical protein